MGFSHDGGRTLRFLYGFEPKTSAAFACEYSLSHKTYNDWADVVDLALYAQPHDDAKNMPGVSI